MMLFQRKIPRARLYINSSLLLKSIISTTEQEDDLKRLVDVSYYTSTSSCRMSFYYLLKAMDLKPGGEVILTPITIPDIVSAVFANGLKPRFVDIDASTYCIDVNDLKEKINNNTVAILVTYLCGLIPDIAQIMEASGRIPVIEDISQSYGACWKGKKLGSFGMAAIGSFSMSKTVSAVIGGGVWSCHKDIIDKIEKEQGIYSRNLTFLESAFYTLDSIKVLILTSFFGFNLCTYWILFLLKRIRGVSVQSIHEKKFSKKSRFIDNAGDVKNVMPEDARVILSRRRKTLLGYTAKRVFSGNDKRIALARSFYGELSALLSAKQPSTNCDSIFWHIPIYSSEKLALQDYLFFKGIDTTGFGLKLVNTTCSDKTPVAERLHQNTFFIPIHDSFANCDMVRMAKYLNDYYEKTNI